MKSLTFQIGGERKTLKVNEKVYTILKNDAEIIEEAAEVDKKLRKSDDPTAFLRFIPKSVDGMLGKDAYKEITGGKVPSMAESIEIYRMLSGAIMEIYEADIKLNYE